MATQGTPYSAVPPPAPSLPPLPLPKLLQLIAGAVAFLPCALLMRLTCLTSDRDSISEFMATNVNFSNPVESRYRAQFAIQASAQRRARAALAAIVSLPATLLIPALRSSYLLYSPLYNWSLLAIVVFITPDNLIDVVVRNAIAALEPRYRQRKRGSYYANALNQHLGSALHSTLILFTWWFLQLSSELHPITRYGGWVCGAWMLRCTLILLNSAAMARWRANVLYDRYEEEILRVGFQVYILYALVSSVGADMSHLVPWRKKEGEVEIVQVASDGSSHVDMYYKVGDHIHYLSDHRLTTNEVAVIAMNILACTTLLPPEYGAYLPDGIGHEFGISPDDNAQIDKTWLKEKFRLKDEIARVLYGELLALVTSPDQVSFHTFKAWMNGAYKDNLEFGQRLREEDYEIINIDRLLVALLIYKAFFLWLFLTGKTTTRVFSVIPFVYCAKCFVDIIFKPQLPMLIHRVN